MHKFWQQLKRSSRGAVWLAAPVIFVEEVTSVLLPSTFSGHREAEFLIWLLLASWVDVRFKPFRRSEECACAKVSRHRSDICRCVLLWLLFLLWVPVMSPFSTNTKSFSMARSEGASNGSRGFLFAVPVVFFCGSVYWSRRLAAAVTVTVTASKSGCGSDYPDTKRRWTRSMSQANTSKSSVYSRGSAHWSKDTLCSWTSHARLTESESSCGDDTDGSVDSRDVSERTSGGREDWTVSSDEDQPAAPPGKPHKLTSISAKMSGPVPTVVLRSRTRMNSSEN